MKTCASHARLRGDQNTIRRGNKGNKRVRVSECEQEQESERVTPSAPACWRWLLVVKPRRGSFPD